MLIIPKKSVATVDLEEYGLELTDSLLFPTGKYRWYVYEKDYRSYNFVRAEILLREHELNAGSEVTIPVVLQNPGEEPVVVNQKDSGRVYLTYYLLQYGKPVIYEKFEDISGLVLKEDYQTSLKMKVPDKPGVYYLKVSIKSGWLPPGINSRLVKIKVK